MDADKRGSQLNKNRWQFNTRLVVPTCENPCSSVANNQIQRRRRVMALNGRVLLLNQTYEPLGTVSVARAIITTFKDSIFVEEWDGDRVLRSVRDDFPVPSVIRRRTYINIRRRREASGMKRLRIYMR